MKNIETILSECGIEITDEQKAKILEGVKENYKTIADYEKQTAKIETLEQTLDETKGELKKFEGVNPEELTSKIAELTKAIEDKDKEFDAKMADRNFNDLVKEAINSNHGLNEIAIRSLLKEDELKASKNQKEDIAKAIQALKEADDSKMLFKETDPTPSGKGDPIGVVQKTGKAQDTTMHSALTEHYSK